MKYFVRLNGAPPFRGPYDDEEIRDRKRSGELFGAIEVVEDTGQTENQLALAIHWHPWRDAPSPPKPTVSSSAAKLRHLNELRATTCYPQLRAVIGGLTIAALAIEFLATIGSLAILGSGLHESGPKDFVLAPALIAMGVCLLEVLFTVALYALVRTVIDLADLSLHRDAPSAQL